MNEFIDTKQWPIVRMNMPDRVPDADGDELLSDLQALYSKQERFVLLMSGAEIPRDSPRFMKSYLDWSRKSSELQATYCAGAVRIEPDPLRRKTYEKQADALERSGKAAYPYKVAADDEAALQQAATLLARAS